MAPAATRSRRLGVRVDGASPAGINDQRQRFQQLFFPDGIAFDGNRFIGTGATAPAFSYLRKISVENEGVVDQNSASWNRLTSWLRGIEALRAAA